MEVEKDVVTPKLGNERSLCPLSCFFLPTSGIAQIDCNSIPNPPTPPLLRDSGGWNHAAYYSTLRVADVDSDGQDEIVIRGRDGIHMFSFHGFGNNWVESAQNGHILSDAEGWAERSYYSTIRLGVLRPGGASIDLIARFRDGIHTYRWDKSKDLWQELIPKGNGRRPLADSATGTDWRLPQHYATIMLGDVDRKGSANLVAHGRRGLETYRWNEKSYTWKRLNRQRIAARDSLNSESSYITMQLVNLFGDPREELVVRAKKGMQVYGRRGGEWRLLNSSRVFRDELGFDRPARFRTVQVFSDDPRNGGKHWLIGLVGGPGGASSAAMAV